jgi:hypothetical protein
MAIPTLAAIRNTFDNIHHSISALEVDERVPMPDNPKVSISYKHLLKLESRVETNYFPEGSDLAYNIRELLDGIEDRRNQHKKDFLEDDVRTEINNNNRLSPIIKKISSSNNSSIMNPPRLTPERQAWLSSLTKGHTVKIWGDNARTTTTIKSVTNGYFFLNGGDMFRTNDGYHSLLKNTWIEPPETQHTPEVVIESNIEEAQELDKHLSQTKSTKNKRNPWKSGSFFLVALVVISASFAIISAFVPWYAFPIILLAAILAVGIVGAFQLSNDDGLTQDNFLKLMIETYKRLPLLIQDKSNRGKSNPPNNKD